MTTEKYAAGVKEFFATLMPDGKIDPNWGMPKWDGAAALRSVSLNDGVLTIVHEGRTEFHLSWGLEHYDHCSRDEQTGEVTIRFRPEFEDMRSVTKDRPTTLRLGFTDPNGVKCSMKFWHTVNYHYWRDLRLAEHRRNYLRHIPRTALMDLVAAGGWRVTKDNTSDEIFTLVANDAVKVDIARGQVTVTSGDTSSHYREKRLEARVQYRDDVPAEITLERCGKPLLTLQKIS